jgi:hypothetical protein
MFEQLKNLVNENILLLLLLSFFLAIAKRAIKKFTDKTKRVCS